MMTRAVRTMEFVASSVPISFFPRRLSSMDIACGPPVRKCREDNLVGLAGRRRSLSHLIKLSPILLRSLSSHSLTAAGVGH